MKCTIFVHFITMTHFCSVAQLQMFLDTYDEVPFEVLQVMTSMINYGGRITDDKDMRTSDVILMTFFRPEILQVL